MRAIQVKKAGGADQLFMGKCEKPTLKNSSSLIVRTKATALNRADINQREGKYPPPPGESEIIGLEIAGIIEEVGKDVKKWKVGDKVCALLPGGGYAEQCCIPEDMAMRIPSGYSFEEAAAIPEAWLTAYQALYWLGELKNDSNVLVHAGASGVGSAATQLAHHRNCKVIVTAGSAEKIDWCKSQGATVGINYNEGPFADKVMAATNDKGVSIVLDFIGASYFQQNLQVLATDGILVHLAAMGGTKVETGFDISTVMKKRIHIKGTTLRNRPLEYKTKLTAEFAEKILPLFDQKTLAPAIDKIFSWNNVIEAHNYMESNKNKGKIVMTVD